MLPLHFLLITILAAIFIQDIKSRTVYWFWFPMLVALLLLEHTLINKEPLIVQFQTIAINLGFLFIQLSIVSLYLSIKHRKWINISQNLIGWGDILFLVSLAFYFSPLTYILFYVGSLLIISVCWLLLILFFRINNKQIPLAGLQAALFIVFLITDWLYPHIGLSKGDWLSIYLYR